MHACFCLADTVEAMPQDIVKYMEFKGYAHYDLLVSRKVRLEKSLVMMNNSL